MPDKKIYFCLPFLIVFLFALKPSHAQTTKKQNSFVRPVYAEVPLGSVRPQGWLLHQLQIMRDGSTGHLDEVYPKLKNDNGWLGGKGDGWEETPYWLDGALPLAYLLDDGALKEKVLNYVNWTLEHQRPSGYFGPITKWERTSDSSVSASACLQGEDWWPRMIMLKVLQQYYTATSDPRVLKFMKSYFQYQLKVLRQCPLATWSEWAQARGDDNMLIAQWLYGLTRDPSLLQLSALIQSQSFPWTDWLDKRDWVIHAAAYQDEKDWMSRHGVNVGMGIKEPAVLYERTGDKKYLGIMKKGFQDLMTLHGLPMGVFSADEDLHGNLPTQGTELCAITESMFSLEQAAGITGEVSYMDALERIAYNALPAQTTDDYNKKQYFQIANQVQISRGVFDFSLPFEREMNNVLGMRSGYTCCLANMHQGWTKFAAHLWYRTPGNGLAALQYGPNQLTIQIGSSQEEVRIEEVTDYPFDDRIRFGFFMKNETAFPLSLRIPSWCREAKISLNGKEIRSEKGGQVIVIDRKWKSGDQLTLQLPMEITSSGWGRNSRAVERGPLVYALKMEERWEKGMEEKEGEYYSVFPKTDWNYGLTDDGLKNPSENFRVKMVRPVATDFVWNLANAPIEISVPSKKIPGWKLVNGVAIQPVTDRTGIYRGAVDRQLETIILVPYGCTKIRIVAFPVVQ
jgi:DUF1680 family protein